MTARIPRLPVRPLMAAGALSGFVSGLFAGCILGGLLAWFSGAVLDWHRQLGFTLGVTEDLLPLGEQVGLLETARNLWWLVVPVSGLVVGLLNGLIGLLAGGLAAGLFNRFAHGVAVELEQGEPALSGRTAEGESRERRRGAGRLPATPRPGRHQ